jgi:hypothetical protein
VSILFKMKLPFGQVASGLAWVKDEESLTWRIILQLQGVRIADFQHFNLTMKQCIWRDAPRHAMGAVGQVRCDNQPSDTPDSHTLNTKSQTGDTLALAEVDLDPRPTQESVAQLRSVSQKIPNSGDDSLSAQRLVSAAENDILDLDSCHVFRPRPRVAGKIRV